jgi:hypothetical protein
MRKFVKHDTSAPEHYSIFLATTWTFVWAMVADSVTQEDWSACRESDSQFGTDVLIETFILQRRASAEHPVFINMDIEMFRRIQERDIRQLCHAREIRAA